VTDVGQMYEAARRMRAEHGPGHPRQAFWSALSGWLHQEACHADGGPGGIDEVRNLPLQTAQAYLAAERSSVAPQ
jgi:hypothetical protein